MKRFSGALLALAAVPMMTTLPVRDAKTSCALQLVHADTELLSHLPKSEREGTITLKPDSPTQWSGAQTFTLTSPRSGSPGFVVELQLRVEKNRSLWLDETPRLTVVTRLKDAATGRLLALNEAHSDQLLTPSMLSWMQEGQRPRVISKMLNPDLQDRLEKIEDPTVRMHLPGNVDAALGAAIGKRLIDKFDAHRVDTVCLIR